MNVLLVSEAAFVLTLAVAALAGRSFRSMSAASRRVAGYAMCLPIAAATVVCCTRWSLRGQVADLYALAIGFICLSVLAFGIGPSFKSAFLRWAAKWLVGWPLVAIAVLGIVGFLGIARAFRDIQITGPVELDKGYSWRLTRDAGDKGIPPGARLDLLYHPLWLPFMERATSMPRYDAATYKLDFLEVSLSQDHRGVLVHRQRLDGKAETTSFSLQ
jgi:hypothetical protein